MISKPRTLIAANLNGVSIWYSQNTFAKFCVNTFYSFMFLIGISLRNRKRIQIHVIWEKFRGQSTTENFRICRMNLQKFMQKDGETIDDFIMHCRLQAQKCKFRDEDEKSERVIDQIILGTKLPDLQKELLGKKGDFTLNDTIELCKKHAASEQHMRQLTNVASQSSSAYTPVNFIRKARQSSGSPKCYFCGGRTCVPTMGGLPSLRDDMQMLW